MKLRDLSKHFSRDDLPVVYISGPMSSLPRHNFPIFNEIARRLRFLGFPVLNPADFGAHSDTDWHACLARDLKIVPDADVLLLLDGWENSKGANLEFDVAVGLGIPCLLQERVADLVLQFFSHDELDELERRDRIAQAIHDPRFHEAIVVLCPDRDPGPGPSPSPARNQSPSPQGTSHAAATLDAEELVAAMLDQDKEGDD